MDDTDAFAAYTQHQERKNLSGATIGSARRELQQLTRWLHPDTVLTVSHPRLLEWADYLEASFMPGSRYVKISRIHAFYKWAHTEGHIDRVPTERVPRPRLKQAIPRPTPISEVIKALNSADAEMRAWVMLAAYGGLRCCEIASLTREQIVDTAELPHLRITGKGGKERVVYLCADLAAELAAYPLPTRGYVFKRRDGRPGQISAGCVSIYGNEFLHKVAGVKETMHQLRHRFGTDLYAASDLLTTADQLGHSNVQTSRGYAQLNNTTAAKAVQSLKLPHGARKAS